MPRAYRYFENVEGDHRIVIGHPSHTNMRKHIKLATQFIKENRGVEVVWPLMKRLGLYFIGDQLVSIKMVKYRSQGYIDEMFGSAGIKEGFGHIKYELGYSFTIPEQRGKGTSGKLSTLMLEADIIDKIFVTTTVENKPVHRMMDRYGFVRVGEPWKANDGMLVMYIRPRETACKSAA